MEFKKKKKKKSLFFKPKILNLITNHLNENRTIILAINNHLIYY